MRKILLLLFVTSLASSVAAQENFPVNGVQDKRQNAFALTNATVYLDYQTKYEQATLLIKDGRVIEVIQGNNVPKGYTKIDASGKTIYPSFIDLISSYGLPKPKSGHSMSYFSREQISPKVDGPYNANDAIKSYYNAVGEFSTNPDEAKVMRNQGFGTVLSHRMDGLARGTSALVTLRDDKDNLAVLNPKVAAHYSWSKGSSKQSYPISRMGYMALLRQTYMDAEWYAQGQSFRDLSLEAWSQNQTLPQIFSTDDKYSVLRADQLGDEFGKQFIIKGGGDEYQRVVEVKSTAAPIIVPLTFPKAYDVDDPFQAMDINLNQLKHWELAPTNPAVLANHGIVIAITMDGLKSKAEFLPNLRKSVENGLSEQDALKALTYTPAKLIKSTHQVGSLKKGMLANFIVTDDNIFNEKAKILENWVQGKKYVINPEKTTAKEGNYTFEVGDSTYQVSIKADAFKIEINDTTSVKVSSKLAKNQISLSYKPSGNENLVRLSGWPLANGWKGSGQNVDGSWLDWSLVYTTELAADTTETAPKKEDDSVSEIGKVIFPFIAYGSETLPAQQNMLIKNTTVWTNEADGILTETDVLIVNGKISAIGKNLSAQNAKVIDGKGKHLTAGIIDEHSHIGLFSVNDVATNSGMVRMKDVINPEHINIYRQLAGGVTTSQLLHGSANPVGGQSAIIKLKWGESAENMLVDDADPFIKFALGENVKRSRSSTSIRYPQTRMGVEQVYMDAFSNALVYQQEWNKFNALSTKQKRTAKKPRRDLVHETMVEILESKRFITCHSYVQSEINMLMKVADNFDFTINTFTHILEGYKVADKMAEHGAGASTFADWWAYKWEVRYAIPYNPVLMHNEGVVVAINSDDAEMGRRLNQEAAKSVKYGGMSEIDALKMVTLNPAKLLHLDDQIGSIKVGKDADLVLWTDHPLSIYARPAKTIIEGTIYFDIDRDAQLRTEIQSERNRLIQKLKESPKSGGGSAMSFGKSRKNFDCDDIVIQN